MAQQLTLGQILERVGSYVDQTIVQPTGDELSIRIAFANQALDEWGNAYQWKQLRFSDSLTSVGGASLGLPANFKKMMSPLVITAEAVGNDRDYTEIRPEERFERNNDVAKNFYILGDKLRGYSAHILPSLASGTIFEYDYQAFPSSMATTTDVCVCPHPNFVVTRATGLVLEARSDTRFPQLKVDANTLLLRLIEEEETPGGAENNRVPDWHEKEGFVIGE